MSYCDFIQTKLKAQKSAKKYKFGEGKQIFLGPILLRISILHNMVVTERVDVFHAIVQFLIKPDLLNK